MILKINLRGKSLIAHHAMRKDHDVGEVFVLGTRRPVLTERTAAQ
jgi:hypothetical protein